MNRLSWDESLKIIITENIASTIANLLMKSLQVSIIQITDFGSNYLNYLIPNKISEALVVSIFLY